MNKIKELRTTTGMTQKEFAEFLGVSKITISSWEEGRRNCPEAFYNLIKYKIEHENLENR